MALATALVAARGYSNPETKQAWEQALALCDPATDPTRSAVVTYGLKLLYERHKRNGLATENPHDDLAFDWPRTRPDESLVEAL